MPTQLLTNELEGETALQEVNEDRHLNRGKKTLVSELEYDIFTWKIEKMKLKKTLRQNPPSVFRLIKDL